MPFINTKVNFPIEKKELTEVKNRLGNAMHLLGKSENYLMLDFEDKRQMFFGGKNDFKMALIEIKVFGSLPDCSGMTEEVTDIFSEVFGIDPDNIYVKYEECFNWGMGGRNF